jgi:hypothetical protein
MAKRKRSKRSKHAVNSALKKDSHGINTNNDSTIKGDLLQTKSRKRRRRGEGGKVDDNAAPVNPEPSLKNDVDGAEENTQIEQGKELMTPLRLLYLFGFAHFEAERVALHCVLL